MVGFGKSEHLTKYHQNALNDELLDVILYYVEDICDDRLKEMTLQAQLYGFITSLAVSIFIITVLVIFPIWYSRISKAKTEESAAKYTQIPKNVKTNNSFNLSDSIDEYKIMESKANINWEVLIILVLILKVFAIGYTT